KLRQTSTSNTPVRPWPPDLNEMASIKPGVIHKEFHITRRESASSSGLIALSRARTWVAASRASNPSVQHKPPVSRLSTRRLDRRLAHRRRGRTARKTYPDQSPLRGRIHPCAEYRHGVVVAGIGRGGCR